MREYLFNVHLDLVVPVRVIAEDEEIAETLAEQEVERVDLAKIIPFCDVVNSDSCVVSDEETDETEEKAEIQRLINFI